MTMSPGPADILRAVVAAGRESRESAGEMRARLERAWSGLSRAEQLALGGTLLAALAGGGLLLRSGLKAMARPLSIAEMRAKKTKHLLRLFGAGNARQQDEIAKFCVCRVHDVRDELLEELGLQARKLMMRLVKLLKRDNPEWRPDPNRTDGLNAQIRFIELAVACVGYDLFALRDLYENDEIWEAARKNATQSSPDAEIFYNKLDEVIKSDEYKEAQASFLQERQNATPGSEEHKKAGDSLQNQLRNAVQDSDEYKNAEAPLRKEVLKIIWGTEMIRDRHMLATAISTLSTLDSKGYCAPFGHIATWDVREVTNMKLVFKSQSFGNTLGVLDLSFWDTSNVRNMSEMFHGYHGNVEVGMWDTGNVTDMGGMFANASDFNGDIGKWDTGKVENMACLFENASKFNCAIGNWNTSNVQHTGMMFYNAGEFNQNLSTWKLDSLQDSDSMFRGSGMEYDEHKKPAKVRSTHDSTLIASLFGQPSRRSYV